jgi:pimeloyl-ACP methyl ester carboxylesterase
LDPTARSRSFGGLASELPLGRGFAQAMLQRTTIRVSPFHRTLLLVVGASLYCCTPGDVAERTPSQTASVSTSPLRASYRVLMPPAWCRSVRAPVVFLPALGFTGHSFFATAERMESCRKRVLVDLPGFEGKDDFDSIASNQVIDAIDDVIRSESGQPVILVGHSTGGAIAARLAARHPAQVEALVLVDAAVAPFGLSWWERLALHPAMWAPAFRLFGQPTLFKRLLPEVIGNPGLIDEFDMKKLAHFLANPAHRLTMLAYYRAFLTPGELERTERALGNVQAPVLVLWGRRDGVLPPSLVEVIRDAIAPNVHVDVRWFPEAAHLLPMERPDEVAAALDELDQKLAHDELAGVGREASGG